MHAFQAIFPSNRAGRCCEVVGVVVIVPSPGPPLSAIAEVAPPPEVAVLPPPSTRALLSPTPVARRSPESVLKVPEEASVFSVLGTLVVSSEGTNGVTVGRSRLGPVPALSLSKHLVPAVPPRRASALVISSVLPLHSVVSARLF